MNWFFFIGLLAPVPVWLLARKYPNHKWIELINMPLIIAGANGIPPVRSINYISWGVVGIFFNFYVYKCFKSWWARHTFSRQLWSLALLSWVCCSIFHFKLMISLVQHGEVLKEMIIVPWLNALQPPVLLPRDVLSFETPYLHSIISSFVMKIYIKSDE
jgi:hypothetical protein